MNIIEMKIADVHPYEKNPRKNDGAVAAVAESIKQFGFKVPIVIDKDGVVVCGHTRLKAAKRLKMKTVPVTVADDLTEEQIKAFRLADNKVSELAEWDEKLLLGELLDIHGIDMGTFGFNIDTDDLVEIVEDEPPEIPEEEEPFSKLGDVYVLGRHRVMCGDSTDPEQLRTLMAGRKADLLLTDPPYNVDYQGSAGKIKNDNMEDSKFRDFLRACFSCADTALRPGSVFYIWHADSEGYNFRGACHDTGWKVRQCLIWNKSSLVLGRQDYQWKHEPCLYGWVDGSEPYWYEPAHEPCLYGWTEGNSHLWKSDRRQTTVIDWDKPKKNKDHPTMKPVGLFDYLIRNSSKPGDAVLDLFGGSGTTVMACEQDGRSAYVMELDPKFVDVIVKRWELFTGKAATLYREGGVPGVD